jgi:hypothetical protein
MADPAPAAPASIKPAWKTTEFWLNAITAVVGTALTICGALGLGPNSKVMMILGMAANLLAVTGHTISRTVIKATAVALLAFGLSFLVGCCASGGAPLKAEVDNENKLMAELLGYINADPKKSDDLKKDEAMRIKAHLDLFNSLTK